MKYDKYWWFGINSWWCRFVTWLGKPQWCLVPTPPEWVTVKLCEKCYKIAVAGCVASGHDILRDFIKGEEPTEKCKPSECCLPTPPPPPTKNRLIKEKHYTNCHKLVCPVLMPEYGITQTTTDKEAEDFADQFAREGWGNFMRLFVAGNWEPFYQRENVISMPYGSRKYPKEVDSVFNLDDKNHAHFDQLFRRAEFLASRDIMPMFTLLDNCSIHIGAGKKNGWWATHWMNGDNNVNGTHNEAYSQTHWYEYDGVPDGEEERKGMFSTGKYLIDLYVYVLEKARENFGDFFLIEIGNEIDARNKYHEMIRTLIDTELAPDDTHGRVFTSMKHDNFYESRQVYQHCIPVLHGVKDYGEYTERAKMVPAGRKHGASQDGREPSLTSRATKENVLDILKSDSVMYEGNLRPLFVLENRGWVNLIREGRYREIDWTLKTLPLGHMRAYGLAFSEYLGG